MKGGQFVTVIVQLEVQLYCLITMSQKQSDGAPLSGKNILSEINASVLAISRSVSV